MISHGRYTENIHHGANETWYVIIVDDAEKNTKRYVIYKLACTLLYTLHVLT